MATGSYLSIVTLNVNGLNAPTKRHRLAGWIQKQHPYIYIYIYIYILSTRDPLHTYRHLQTENKGIAKGISCKRK